MNFVSVVWEELLLCPCEDAGARIKWLIWFGLEELDQQLSTRPDQPQSDLTDARLAQSGGGRCETRAARLLMQQEDKITQTMFMIIHHPF